MDLTKCDFAGWATRNDLLCIDGRTICKDAFKHQDGEKVPLIYGHNHGDVNSILGHAYLENRDEGVYAYCFLNDTESGQAAKKVLKHGDVSSLSIWANKLKQVDQNGMPTKRGNVIHGNIKELSLVLAGANPGAYIESVLAHSDEGSEEIEELNACWNENIVLYHSDEKKEDDEVSEKKDTDNEKTIQDIVDTMSEEQQNAMYALIAEAIGDDEDNEGD